MTEKVTQPEETGLPTAVWSGSFRLFGVDVKCHTLSNGQRIIEADSMAQLLDAMGSQDTPRETDDAKLFAAWRVGATDATVG